MITEAQLEQLALQWFQDTGWSYVHGSVIAPEGKAVERDACLRHLRQLKKDEICRMGVDFNEGHFQLY